MHQRIKNRQLGIVGLLILALLLGGPFLLSRAHAYSHELFGDYHHSNGATWTLAPTSVSSVKSGNWSDLSVWNTKSAPKATDSVTISSGHTITYNVADSKISGLVIADNAKLEFAPAKTVLLRTDKNILLLGELEMKPSSAAIHHTIRFVNVNERKFIGGGMNVLDPDIGLWVRGDGVLDIAGTPKTAWTRLQGSAKAGSLTITLQTAPSGWRIGDEISVVPTEPPSVGDASWNGFEERTIVAVVGNLATLNKPLSRNHPAAIDPISGKTFTAEVLNLSRNVHIEGTGDGSEDPARNGRAHIQIISSDPQSVKYAELKLLGPRTYSGGYTSGVLGRYPLHFHHNMRGSRGSVVEGVVTRKSGAHAFVPHASHGIVHKDTIAYDTWEEAYWWDPVPKDPVRGINTSNPINDSDDVVYDRAVAAIVKFDPEFRGYALTGFYLGSGLRNVVKDSVAVGVQGNSDAAGFLWPEALSDRSGQGESGVWTFGQGNIAHNNKVHGSFVWQNTGHHHVVKDFVVFHNGDSGADHGAYINNYEYIDVISFGNGGSGLEAHAAARTNTRHFRPDGYSQAFERYRSTGTLLFPKHSGETGHPVLFKDCVFSDVIVNDATDGGKLPTIADFVNCTKPNGRSLEPADFALQNVVPGMDIRVQRPNGTAFRLQNGGVVKTISSFYAGVPVITNQSPRVNAGLDQSVSLLGGATITLKGSVTDDGLPNPPGKVSTSWKVVSGPGPVSFGKASAADTKATFTAPGAYVLRLSANDGDLSSSDDVIVTVIALPTNHRPTVDAGANQTVSLNSPITVSLKGSVNDDGLPNPPGKVSTFWALVSGPAFVAFGDATALNTTATFTVAGTYLIRLWADDGKLSAADDVAINVLQPTSSPTLISYLTVGSGRSYQVVDNGFAPGAQMFIDRKYAVTAAPPSVKGATYIQTANDDKNNSYAQLLSFFLKEDARVYVGYDSRASSLPNWLRVWGPNSGNVGTTDVSFALYSKAFPAGSIVSLGGNKAAGAAGADSNYFVVVVPQRFVPSPTNLPPVVNAGPDITLTQPAVASLHGSVSDDGLPASPGKVITSWQKISGPGNVFFADAAAKDTTATFSAAGTYVLRFSASDGDLSAFNDITVNVTSVVPTNRKPSVDAGPSRSASLNSPATVSLDGLVSDDGLPNPPGTVSTSWTVVSGPGPVTFGNAAAVDTTATFTVAGNYVLRLSADDGSLTAFDEVTVAITTVPTNQPPRVEAGPDRSATMASPATVSLDGAVSDDGLPNPPGAVSTSWTVVSGPGPVTFGNAGAADTTATFTVAGKYVLRLSANDGSQSASDEVSVTITAPSNTQPLMVSNLRAASEKTYRVQTGGFASGVEVFMDREYVATSVPEFVAGAAYIQTANDDKYQTGESFLSFSLSREATVYVAYDHRGKSLPNWLSGWKAGGSVNTTDVTYNLYAREFEAGNVTLGGNRAAGAVGADSNYFVLVVPR